MSAATANLCFVEIFFIELMVPLKERILFLNYKNCNESEMKSIIYWNYILSQNDIFKEMRVNAMCSIY